MILRICTYGEDILRQKAKDIDLEDPNLLDIIKDMWETMYNAKGAGLSAPQIGLNSRIIVIDEKIEDQVLKGVFLNPKIINYLGVTTVEQEGCLSFPTLYGRIIRRKNIEAEWYDENKIYYKKILTGMQSRILQHEIDHLDGVLFIDRMNSIDKLKNFMKLEDIKNKRYATS